MSPQRTAVPAALAWLTHPVTCVALVLLVVNDHVLKAALGTWWTGKLSDVAWLVVVPPLTAVALAGATVAAGAPLRARTCTRASIVVVGAVFVVVKSSAAAASVASQVLTALAGPSTVLADPTDLMALPALALAFLAARATSTEPRGDRRRDLRWVVVLPLVVLATAATSTTPPDSAQQVALVDGSVVVGDGAGSTWYVSDDGTRWTAVSGSSDEDEALDERFQGTGATLTEACAPPSGTECFRVAATGVGVDRSDDAGRTWERDWMIPDELLDELAARYQPERAQLGTQGIAVLPTTDGFRVVAANGGDGLAVRDEDGSWTRTGFTYLTDGPPVVPLPGEPTTMTYPVPFAVMLAVPAGVVTLVLSTRRHRRPGTGSGRTGGWVLVAVAAVLSIIGVRVDDASAVVSGQELGTALVLGNLLVPAAVGCLFLGSAALLVVGAIILLGPRAAAMVVATGVGVALAVGLVTPTVLAAVVAVALLVAGSVATARLAAAAPGRAPQGLSD